MARQFYTRWERDRLGKMVLRQATYRVLGRSHVVERGLALRDAAMISLASSARFLVVLVVALSFGCSGAPTAPSFVFTPDPVLESTTHAWSERWSDATGLSITVGVGGVPVLDDESLQEQTDDCGEEISVYKDGRLIDQKIEIDRTTPSGCSGWSYIIGHEMGHALGAGHAASGIMQEFLPLNHVYKIDSASLSEVCAHTECAAFNPEEP